MRRSWERAERVCQLQPSLLAGVCYSVVAVNLFGGRTGTTPLLRNCLTRFDREPIMMAGMRPRYALYYVASRPSYVVDNVARWSLQEEQGHL